MRFEYRIFAWNSISFPFAFFRQSIYFLTRGTLRIFSNQHDSIFYWSSHYSLSFVDYRLISLHNIHSSRNHEISFRVEGQSEKSKKKCVITAWGDDGGQGRLMPRNGCNERGPGSGRSNDLCNTTAWPHQIWYRGTCWEHVETPPPWLGSRGGKKCVQHVRRGLRAKLYGHRRLLSCAYRGRIGNLYLRLMIEREKKKWALEFGTKLLEGDNNNVFGGRGFIEGIGVGRNNVFGN